MQWKKKFHSLMNKGMTNLKSTVNTKGACELLWFFGRSTCTYVDAMRYVEAALKLLFDALP